MICFNKTGRVVVIRANRGPKTIKTVIDLVPKPHAKDILPVGRLDKDTEGLLINNKRRIREKIGATQASVRLKKQVDKTYFDNAIGRRKNRHRRGREKLEKRRVI